MNLSLKRLTVVWILAGLYGAVLSWLFSKSDTLVNDILVSTMWFILGILLDLGLEIFATIRKEDDRDGFNNILLTAKIVGMLIGMRHFS